MATNQNDSTRRQGETTDEYAERLGLSDGGSDQDGETGGSGGDVQERATDTFREAGATGDSEPAADDQTEPADPTDEGGGGDGGGALDAIRDIGGRVGDAVTDITGGGGGGDGGGQETGPRESTDSQVARANRTLSGRRDAAAENRARAPSDRDVDQAVGQANAQLSQTRENLREFRDRQRDQQPTGEGSSPRDPLGGTGPVQNLRETIDEGTTVSVDSVRVPGTAGRVPIPEQQITLSGQGLRSARQDVRSATGIPFGSDREQPGGTTERSGVDRGDFDLDELPGTDDSRLARGQNQLQRDFIQGVATTQRRRQRAGEGLPDRSVFSVAPAAPTGVPLLLSSSAATAGGATAGGTGATGGSAAGGATGTGTASSTALEAGSLLASAGAATGLTGDRGEIPVRDRFGEPELETGEPGTGAEVDVPSDGGRFGESELEAGETGPQPLEVGVGDVFPGAEIPLGDTGSETRSTTDGRDSITPDEFPLRDDRVTNILGERDGTGTVSASPLFEERESADEDEEDVVELFEEEIAGTRPEPGETPSGVRNPRDPGPTIGETTRGVGGGTQSASRSAGERLRERIEQAEESRVEVDETELPGQERSIDFGEESEPEVQVGETGLEPGAETAARPTLDTFVGPRAGGRLRPRSALAVDTDEDVAVRPRPAVDVRPTQAVGTQPRTGTRTTTDIGLDLATDTTLDLGLDTGQRFTPENVTRPTATETANPFETPNPPGFETVTEEFTNDFGISPPGATGPTSEPRLRLESDEEDEERLRGFGGRDALFSSGFASGEELLEIAVDDTDSN